MSLAGFIPNFGRLGSWNVAMFLTLEQVNFIFAMNAHDVREHRFR